MSVYTYGDPAVHGRQLTQTESHIYGSSRLGILKRNVNVQLAPPVTTSQMHLGLIGDSIIFTRGNTLYELTNHLGNVLATVSDKRFGVSADSMVRYFIPDLIGANDYYPFGSMQPGRSYVKTGGGYRYGFSGKEKDDEVKGAGNQIDYGMRIYDPRIGRFLSTDPLSSKYPGLTPYQYASNRPVDGVDQDGLEWAQPDVAFVKREGYVEIQTTFTVKVHVEKSLSKIQDPAIIKARAEAYAQSIEHKFSGESEVFSIYGISFKQTFKTNVILDYTPADPHENTGRLVFDDRTSKKESEKTVYERPESNSIIFGERTTSTTTTISGSTPGVTSNGINDFKTTIGILMDGKPVSDEDFANTSAHEGGHSAGLNHPWQLKETEIRFNPRLNQKNAKTVDKTAVKDNIMNSTENPDPKFRGNSGQTLTLDQLRAMYEILKKRSNFESKELQPPAAAQPANDNKANN
jgi:RHS repeat-associated protein